MHFPPNRLAALLVVEEHPVANVVVEDREERFQRDLRLHLLATLNYQDERVLLVEPTATRGTQAPRANKSRGRKERLCSNPYRVRWSVVFVSIWIDTCQAKWRNGSNKSWCRMDGCTVSLVFLLLR